MLEFDPIASMRIWAVEVDLGPHVARIPPTCAADWLPTLMRMDVMGVLDLVEGVDITDALIDGEITSTQARDAAVKLLESAAGRTCWTTMALVSLATRYWGSIGADLMRVSVKFDQISLGAALDAIYGSLCKGMDEKGIRRLNVTLERAPLEFTLALGGQPPPEPQRRRGVKPLPATAMQYVQTRPKTVLRKPLDRQPSPSALPMPLPAGLGDSDLEAMSESQPDDGGSHPAE
jgi:hypothetical protein